MKSNIFQIIKPSSQLRINKNFFSIVTECLFGEHFEVIKSQEKWSYGISLEDKYEGWLLNNDLGISFKSTHVISSIRTFVLSKPDIKSLVISFLPIRSRVAVLSIKNDWAKIRVFGNKLFKDGYVLSSHILDKLIIKKNWVKFAEMFVEIPYRWGGRNSIGVDCSALVQLSKGFAGERLPRDSNQQFEYFDKSRNYTIYNDIYSQSISRGNIIYWEGHIAIIVDKKNIVHANAFHGKVVIENIQKAINRIGKKYFIIINKNES